MYVIQTGFNKLTNNSVLQLDNFLSTKTLKNIQIEAKYLHSKAYYCSQNHTVLLNKKNNNLDDDPCNLEVKSDKGSKVEDIAPEEGRGRKQICSKCFWLRNP